MPFSSSPETRRKVESCALVARAIGGIWTMMPMLNSDKDYLPKHHPRTEMGSGNADMSRHGAPPRGMSVSTGIVFSVLCIGAFLIRLLPLYHSPYPFNNDSLVACGIASDIMTSGHLDLSHDSAWSGTTSLYTPLMNLLLAFFSSSHGVNPVECAQLVAAVLSVVTIAAVALMGRIVSGFQFGGFAAGFAALLMGTFVFTTGSVWKETLSMSLFVLLIYSYMQRNQPRFRMLLFLILVCLPFAHHLTATVAFMMMTFLLIWSLFFAITHSGLQSRHYSDLLSVGLPVAVALVYYPLVADDQLFGSNGVIEILLLSATVCLLCLLAMGVLLRKSHSKWTFSPIVGAGLVIFLLADYLGYSFQYTPSVAHSYLLLVLASGIIVAAAWYGTEVIIERRPAYRAVQLGLLVSPITIMIFGLLGGFSVASHQVIYRTFDFLDVFIFLGIGMAFVTMRVRRSKIYLIVAICVIASLAISFPFAYESEQLLGVRHDTQTYEVEAAEWLDSHAYSAWLVSDERLGYISSVVSRLPKDPILPQYLLNNVSVSEDWFCMAEDSWTTTGVNDYPRGEVVILPTDYMWALAAADVIYLGGPLGDRIAIFAGSETGRSVMHVNSG